MTLDTAMILDTNSWQGLIRHAAACALLVIASGGCRSYMVALEYDQGKYDVFNTVFGNCNDRCQHCSRSSCGHSSCGGCNQCSGGAMTLFSEEPPYFPTGQPVMGTGSGEFVMESSAGPPIRSAAFTDELPATPFLPVPVRPVFAPHPPMASTMWED